jgi:hypothetical protein
LNGLKAVTLAVAGGVVITLLTGLVDNTPEGLMGAVWYGYPLPWLVMRVLAPQYFPWVLRPLRFIVDIVVWSIVVWVILFLLSKVRKK